MSEIIPIGGKNPDGPATAWTPRQLLLDLLRDIDAGLEIDGLIVAIWTKDHKVLRRISNLQGLQALGLMDMVRADINTEIRG